MVLTPAQEAKLPEAARIFYESESERTTAGGTRWQGSYIAWADLPDARRRSMVDRLRANIERETLGGFLTRKKQQLAANPAGLAIIIDTETRLRQAGLL